MTTIHHLDGDPTNNSPGNLIDETRLATIAFDPWFGDSPENRQDWSIRIDFLDRKSLGAWLQRQYRATVYDAAQQVVAIARADKAEGASTRVAMDSLCRQLGQWWAIPDHGAYSVDWLCGYFAGIRNA